MLLRHCIIVPWLKVVSCYSKSRLRVPDGHPGNIGRLLQLLLLPAGKQLLPAQSLCISNVMLQHHLVTVQLLLWLLSIHSQYPNFCDRQCG